MIITCPNCNKQFNIDNSAIPDEGRDLQCGSCNHVWFYKVEEENSEVLKLNDEIVKKDIETNAEKKEEKIEEKKQPTKEFKTEINNEKKDKIIEKQKNTTIPKNTENKI